MRRSSSSAAAMGLVAAALVTWPAVAAADIPPASGFVHQYTVNTVSTAAYVENDGWCTLQEALDTIVKPSTFSGDCGQGAGATPQNWLETTVRIRFAGAGRGAIKLTEELIVRPWSHVLIDGRGENPHDEKVVLDGQGVTRVLRAAGPLCDGFDDDFRTVLLRDLTITNGKAPAPRWECWVKDLDRIGGGVVTDKWTSLIVDRVTFTDNEAIGGAAIGFHGYGSISDSTFAFNRTITYDLSHGPQFDGGAVYVYEGDVRVDASTFFHNTLPDGVAPGANEARDLLGAWSWEPSQQLVRLLSYINVHVSAPDAAGRTCVKSHPYTTVRAAGVDTSPPPEHTPIPCDSYPQHNAVLMPVGQDLQPLAPGANPRDALLDWGGWVPTIAFAPGSANHGRGGNSLTCNVLLREPALVWSPMRENPRGRDARGVDRPMQFCDAGSLEREFQTIDFPQPAAGTAAGSTLFTPTATSGAPVTLTAGPEAVCSVTASGVRLHAAGECTVTAAQEGNALYRPAAPVTRTFTVSAPEPQTITFDPPAPQGVVGTPLTLTAIGGGSGNPVTLLVPPPTRKGAKPVCSLTPVSSTGATTIVTVSFLTAGTCTIEAVQAGGGSFLPAAAFLDIAVETAPKQGGGGPKPPKNPK